MFSSKDIFFTPPSGGYRIEKSLRFRSSASANLSRAISTTSSQTTFTLSAWIKRGQLSSSATFTILGDSTNTTGEVLDISNDALRWSSYNVGTLITTQVFRDPSAWYHVVFALDTTNATSSSRIRMYVNGAQISAFSTASYPALNSTCQRVNTSGVTNYIGGNVAATAVAYFDGYLAEVNFIDGQALTPSSFGETDATTGVWKPKAYTGTHGTNGFYLKFTDVGATSGSNTGYGKDFAGTNYWTTNNFGTTSTGSSAPSYDSMWDTPTSYDDSGNGVGNYAVPNPLDVNSTTLSNGNLQVTSGATSAALVRASFSISSGKWYWEVTCGTQTSTAGMIGVTVASAPISAASWTTAFSWMYFGQGQKYNNNSGAAYGASYTTGDVIGVALDADAGSITFYKNGASQGVAYNTGLSGLTLSPSFGNGTTGGSQIYNANFGQRPFAHTPPSGFKALNTQNLLTPTIAAGDDYFNVILYTGTGASNARTGVGFQPDLVWIKERNAAADHGLYDAVRGAQKQLESNTTTDETTETTGLTAFDPDGFTVGALAQLNTNNDTYVAWNWKESAAAGFDIVTYTGNGTARTISHNLNATPNMIIVKARTTASTDQGWPVYHSANTAAPETDYLMLNTTAATADLDTVWNDTSPTDAVFSVGTNALVNANNDTYVAYLWSAVAGYSAFGSYTGNGSADGPFVFTGFRPRYVMVKRSDSTGNWFVWDSARDPYNTVIKEIYPDSSSAETTRTGSNDSLDFVSNGFKIRFSSTFADRNANGGIYIYAAFAENPFSKALAR
jgi:hypothetical protein